MNTNNTTIVKFRINIQAFDQPIMQVMAITTPLKLMKSFTFGEVYNGRPYRSLFDFPWVLDTVYDCSLDHSPFEYKLAARGLLKNVDMDDLFGPEVRVGDMMVIFHEGSPTCGNGPVYGFVCGEGNSWGIVALDDNNALMAEGNNTPCAGRKFLREAYTAYTNHLKEKCKVA